MNRQMAFDWAKQEIKRLRFKRRGLKVWVMEDIEVAYLSIPKVASSSIRHLIRERQAKIVVPYSQENRKALKNKIEKKIKISITPPQLPQLKERFYLFSFVRNPLTRLYSCYRDKVINAVNKHDESNLSPYGIKFGMSFEEFINRVSQIPDERADQHFISQHTFLTHGEELWVQFLGKFKRFESDWQHLTEAYGLACPSRTRRVSGPPVPLLELPLTRRGAETAIARYQKDIELFGYQDEIKELLERI
jgi:dermatan 4-sulfotransferase 1